MPAEAKIFRTELAHNRRGEDSDYGPYYDRFVLFSPVDHRADSDIGWPVLRDPESYNLWDTVCDTEEKLARCTAFAAIYEVELAAAGASCRAAVGDKMGFEHWMAIGAVAKERAKERWAARSQAEAAS